MIEVGKLEGKRFCHHSRVNVSSAEKPWMV